MPTLRCQSGIILEFKDYGDGDLLNGVVLGYKIPLEERTHPINLKIKKLKVKKL